MGQADELRTRAASRVELGERLRRLRSRRGLSLRELARRAGCSASLLSQVERGQTTPSAGIVYALANELDISIDSLFDGGGDGPDRNRRDGNGPDGNGPDGKGPGENGPSGNGAGRDAGRSGPEPAPRPGSDGRGGGTVPDAALVRFPHLPASGEPSAPVADAGTVVQRAGSRRRIELMTGVIWERLTPRPDPRVDFLEVHYAPRAHSTESSNMIRHEGREYLVVVEGEIFADVGFETYRLAVGDSVAFESSTPHQYRNVADAPARVISIVVHDPDRS